MQGRHEGMSERQFGADVNRRGNNIVTALAAIDMIIGVHRLPQFSCGEARNHFIGIHIGTGARAGLEHIHGELIVMLCRSDRQGRRRNALGHRRFQQAQIGIGASGSCFDHAEAADESLLGAVFR